MKQNIYTTSKKRWYVTIVFFVMTVLPMAAGGTSTQYYYKATAMTTGGGKVYVALNSTDNPSYQSGSSTTGTQSTRAGDEGGSVTFYYYAKADNNYIFDHWAKGSANGENVSTRPDYTVTETGITSTSQNNPTSFTYYAVFVEQTGLVKVFSENAQSGIVAIDEPNNVLGSQVTLTATPDVSNGVTFLGWKKGSTSATEYISTDNPLSFTVTAETEGNYYACFSEPLQKVYCRIQNVQTGRFLMMYGNTHTTNHQGCSGSNTYTDGYYFTNSLKLISPDDAQGNPSTVFLRAGNPFAGGTTTGANLSAQGVSYEEDLIGDANHKLTMLLTSNENSIRKYTISTTIAVQDGNNTVNLTSYLCDEGTSTEWVVMKPGDAADESNLWYVYILNAETTNGAFGANTKAKFTKDGKYYTTMYTTFPYELLDDVKAYYLDKTNEESWDSETNTAEFQEVTSGKVPANTAVVLECTDVQNGAATTPVAVNNRLRPITSDEDPVSPIVTTSNNLLKGYVSLNGSTVTNVKEHMYVLSAKDGKLGFFRSSKGTMTPNKAYVDLETDVSDAAQSAKFRFGRFHEDETPTTVQLLHQQSDEDAPVFDLQGRKVVNVVKGVYIKNGKKFFVK